MDSAAYRSPDVQGGVPVFGDTRVPIATIFDYREARDSLDEFLLVFPSVTRKQAMRLMERAKEALLAEPDEAASGG
jgi:uncharacterized protein (DUF433 family)